jgi:formate hydrogenlyase subunit 3/multisubunit Na+/H+ antiporter MnhD subunit
MIDRNVFIVLRLSAIPLLCIDALLFVFSKEQELAGKFFSIGYFHGTLCLITIVASSLFRLFSGRTFKGKRYTESEKKCTYFAILNALVCIPLFFAFSADWFSNPPELFRFLQRVFGRSPLG